MKPKQIEIYDTTLRDGSQGEGINFSLSDKLRIAERLDQFGVHYIEGGWPGSNPKDLEFFKQAARRKWKNARIASFGFTRRKGVSVENDEQIRMLLDAETPVITIVGKTWLLHVTEVLRAKPDENIGMIGDTIRFLKDHGKIVVYDAEHSFDGFKDQPEYALATWQAAEQAGADVICLCDTNGGCLPSEIARITAFAKGKLSTAIGIHTHNDCGLGVANGIAALEAGATQIQGVINGYGERTGNCNLTSVIPRSCRSSWTASPTCGTTRANRGSARRPSLTRAASTCTRSSAWPAATSTSRRSRWAIIVAFWSATCRAGPTSW
jgi:2-isopropylmalate synthase